MEDDEFIESGSDDGGEAGKQVRKSSEEEQEEEEEIVEGEEDDNEEEEEEEEDEDEEEEEGEEEEEEEEDELLLKTAEKQKPKPFWACKYCDLDDPACVVRCLESDSWFCNSLGDTSASHIIQHLVRGRRKEICLHPDSPLGETIIECYNCASRNVFIMGFLPKGDGVVILLCRNCLALNALKEMEWNPENWSPIIKDKSFVNWLVKAPSSADAVALNQKRVTSSQIEKLETLWKTNPKATLIDLEAPGAVDDEPLPVLLKYDDGFHYQNVFGPLVQIEADYDRDLKLALKEDNVSIKWGENSAKDWILLKINFSPTAWESFKLMIGDELQLTLSKRLLSLNNSDWCCKCTVIETGDLNGNPTVAELKLSSKPPIHISEGYTIEFVWKAVTFERMQNALKQFATNSNSITNYLYRKILGHTTENEMLLIPGEKPLAKFNAPGLPDLNPSQQLAIQQVLQTRLALIQGPPGTGKTVTLATLVYHMVTLKKKNSKSAESHQVLVCAPSNVAVDHLVEKISATGVKVVRLSAKSREHVASSVSHLTLHHMVEELESHYQLDQFGSRLGEEEEEDAPRKGQPRLGRKWTCPKCTLENDTKMNPKCEACGAANPALVELKKKKKGARARDGEETKSLLKRRRKFEETIIRNADVICCTCAGAGDKRIVGMNFRRVLIDEATQATEPECLIPLVHGCEQLILVGDHCQLGPVVISNKAGKAGLSSSLFERLVTLGVRPSRLTIQYRMHPCLSEWPSNTFYEGSLQNGVTAKDRQQIFSSQAEKFPWIDSAQPMMFYVSLGSEEMGSTGVSYLNRAEAGACEKVVSKLLQSGVAPTQIGVVTPYEGQRSFIQLQFQRNGVARLRDLYAHVEVSSVDAFQGREKEYIVVSCVRSNEKQGIGFLNDPRRLNVALTRAKRGLVLLGNPRVLSKFPLWNNLLCHFKERSLLVEGSLNNLMISQMRFAPTGKFYKDPRLRLFEENQKKVFSGDVHNPYGDPDHYAHRFTYADQVGKQEEKEEEPTVEARLAADKEFRDRMMFFNNGDAPVTQNTQNSQSSQFTQ